VRRSTSFQDCILRLGRHLLCLVHNIDLIRAAVRLDGDIVVDMKPVADELVRNYLMHQLQVPDYKAEVCVAFARGNIGKAKSFLHSCCAGRHGGWH